MPANLFIITATALAWAGAAMLAFALFGDAVAQRVRRLRGTARKRCPKCWYDLSHSAPTVARPSRPCESLKREETTHGRGTHAIGLPIQCSECGRIIKSERDLYRGRRRWSLAGFALAVLLASYLLNVTPDIRQRGIVAALPTTGLIFAMPWLGSPYPPFAYNDQREQLSINNELSQEFLERLYRCNRLWGWQEWLIVERALRGDRARRPVSPEWNEVYGEALHVLRHCRPEADADPTWLARAEGLITVRAHTRAVWPVGTPIYATYAVDRWMIYRDQVVALTPAADGLSNVQFVVDRTSDCGIGMWGQTYRWGDRLLFLGVPDPTATAIEYEVSIAEFDFLADAPGRTLRRHPLRLPIRLAASVDEILEPVHSDEITEFLVSRLEPVLLGSLTGDNFALRLWRESSYDLAEAPTELRGVTIAFALDVLRNGAVTGAARAWFAIEDSSTQFSVGEVQLEDSFRPAVPVGMDWFDGGEAGFEEETVWTLRLRSDPYTALRNFASDRYWIGEIEMPLRLDVWAER